MQVFDGNGGSVLLDSPIAQGAEGEIRKLASDRAHVAKVFLKPRREHEEKIRTMTATPPLAKGQGGFSLAWPKSLLYHKKGSHDFVGYVMPYISGMAILYSTLVRVRTDRAMFPPYALAAAENLAAMFAVVHDAGFVIGDVNDRNLLAARNGKVAAVDTDSFQVRRAGKTFYCTVGRPEYTAPEFQGVDFSKSAREPHQDNFALGVILFQLLMSGDHPFRVKYTGSGNPPPLHERIKRGFFAYSVRPAAQYLPPADPARFTMLPQEIQDLFRQCFDDGHREPSFRPTADDWSDAFCRLKGQWPQQTNSAAPGQGKRKRFYFVRSLGKRIPRQRVLRVTRATCGASAAALAIWAGTHWFWPTKLRPQPTHTAVQGSHGGEASPELWKRYSKKNNPWFSWRY